MAREQTRPKTWSLLGEVRRRPTPYDVVTSNFHYHFRRDPVPFELDPSWSLNEWYLRHREGSPFQVDDWNGFRDPAKLTYKDYVALQHDREVYLDGVIDRFEEQDSLRGFSDGWIEVARSLIIPLRFPLHVLQMVGLYVGQMAPAASITNAAHFQAADELRRIQRIVYWTKSVANLYGDELARTSTARDRWEDASQWQPLRKVLVASRGWWKCRGVQVPV
jgi:toluene monooxygenase system protein E